MSSPSTIVSLIRSIYPAMRILENEPMKDHTSFRIGGRVPAMFFPGTFEEAAALFRLLSENDVRTLAIGNGTNLLVSDEGVDAAVIAFGDNLSGLSVSGENEITAMAGALLSRTASFARDHGLSGLEFAHGIPGSVGGAVCMNAGAYGGEIRGVAVSVTAADRAGCLHEIPAENCDFAYRHSMFDENWLVLSVRFRLTPGDPAAIQERMTELAEKRRASQPLAYPSAGSTFKRPANGYAAAMIEGAGLKGKGVGGARVSEKHAGFVISDGSATFRDVTDTMEMVRQAVKEKYGTLLEPEVRIVR